MKLRISWHAQSTAAAIRGLDETAASELGYFRLQPTSDERILRSIGYTTQGGVSGLNEGTMASPRRPRQDSALV